MDGEWIMDRCGLGGGGDMDEWTAYWLATCT